MSSTDSDDEDLSKIQDAISPELAQFMSSHSTTDSESIEITRKLPKNSKKEITDKKNLNPTTELHNRVFEKLSSYLDSVLEDDQSLNHDFEKLDEAEGGVKLLSNSSCFLSEAVHKTSKLKKKHIIPSSSSGSDDDYSHLSCVAVSGADVLLGGEGAFKHPDDFSAKKKRKKKKQSRDKELPLKKAKT